MKLHKYQERAVDFIKSNPRCYLQMSVGLGKTLTVLQAIRGLSGKTLVVAPKRVARHTWSDEIVKWGYSYRTSIVMGTPKQRLAALAVDADIYVTNSDALVWLVEQHKKSWPFCRVVFDEASLYKQISAKRTKAAKWIGRRDCRIVMLSGTPAANSLLDLYAQYRILDNGERLGKSMARYKNKYFYPTDWNQYNWVIRPGSDAEIATAISDITLSLSSDDYLQLPDLIINDVPVHLSKAKDIYDEMVDKLHLEYADTEIDGVNAGVMVGKLSQISSGAIYDDERNVVHIHKRKMEALADIIEESSGEPVIVVYQYKHTLARIQAQHKEVRIADYDGIKDWGTGAVKILALHNSTSHGLNLQGAGHIMVFVDLPWSGEAYTQMCGRLMRQGQQHPVVIHRLIGVDTIDEDICAALESKVSIQQTLLSHLKGV